MTLLLVSPVIQFYFSIRARKKALKVHLVPQFSSVLTKTTQNSSKFSPRNNHFVNLQRKIVNSILLRGLSFESSFGDAISLYNSTTIFQ